MAKITVQNTEVNVMKVNGEDYICLTDMLRAKDGDFFITDWLRNRNTLEYIGIWEKVYNPYFNYGEFAIIKNHSGLNSFKISVKEFVARTNAICVQAKAGRYGGTYAHKDIAFEFAMWISPEFKIYIVREFQRLKSGRAAVVGLVGQARTVENKLSYTYRCNKAEPYPRRGYIGAGEHHLCQRSRRIECGDVRHDGKTVEGSQSRTERQHS